MSKITLNQIADITQSTSAQNTINADLTTVQTAFDNTLSRDGTSPNQMNANLDLNGNRILNLPQPTNATDPVRLQDLSNTNLTTITVTNPTNNGVLYSTGTNSALTTTSGTSGQILTSAGSSSPPIWTSAGSGTVNVTGGAPTSGHLASFSGSTLIQDNGAVSGDATLSNSNVLTVSAGAITFSKLSTALQTLPTTQILTSGSSTYTKPTNALWLKIRMYGGGGGGGGTGSSGGSSGGTGGTTSFGTSFLSATGGSGGGLGTTGAGSSPGIAGSGSGGVISLPGTAGFGGFQVASNGVGGGGGSSVFGGSGNGGLIGNPGGSGGGNMGAGGGGGGGNGTSVFGGGGGGSGGYTETWITSPNATYSYSIGAGGTAGTAGTSGFAGGAGGSGLIIVEEYYK